VQVRPPPEGIPGARDGGSISTRVSAVTRNSNQARCRNADRFQVGTLRALQWGNSTVSISGTSTPSLKRSTVNAALMSRRRSASRAARRSAGEVREVTDAEATPASLKARAMSPAWSMLTQNPSARMRFRSVAISDKRLEDDPHPHLIGGVQVGQFGGDIVEHDQAPDQLLGVKNNLNGQEAMTRPICPYPLVARYDGTGSTNDATGFACSDHF
jgi:hypothetical protein